MAHRGLEIHAAVLRNLGGPLRIETLELEPPRADEVLVRVVASVLWIEEVDE